VEKQYKKLSAAAVAAVPTPAVTATPENEVGVAATE